MSFRPRNRALTHKHETPEDRQRRHSEAISRPSSFIKGIHDQLYATGVPLRLLAEYQQMEAATPVYATLRRI